MCCIGTYLISLKINLNTENNCTVGFKAKGACDLLEITKETLRYWKKHLDPIPNRSTFSSIDIFKYRIFKELIYYSGVSVRALEKYNWKEVFEHCDKVKYSMLEEFNLILDKRKKLIHFLKSNETTNYQSNRYLIVYLDEVYQEHVIELQLYGVDGHNVIPISRGLER